MEEILKFMSNFNTFINFLFILLIIFILSIDLIISITVKIKKIINKISDYIFEK